MQRLPCAIVLLSLVLACGRGAANEADLRDEAVYTVLLNRVFTPGLLEITNTDVVRLKEGTAFQPYGPSDAKLESCLEAAGLAPRVAAHLVGELRGKSERSVQLPKLPDFGVPHHFSTDGDFELSRVAYSRDGEFALVEYSWAYQGGQHTLLRKSDSAPWEPLEVCFAWVS